MLYKKRRFSSTDCMGNNRISSKSTIRIKLKTRRGKSSATLKRQGFLLMELLFVMALFSIVMTVSIIQLNPRSFQEHVSDIAFMNELKGAIIRQRMQSVRELGIDYHFYLLGDGTVTFVRNGKSQLVIDDPAYRVYVTTGEFKRIRTEWSFNNRPASGENGFTLNVHKNGKLMAKLIYQFNTHTFREVFQNGE